MEALEQASWTLVETRFEPERQRHKETIFTIGNGYQCIRGAFEEGYPGDHPAGFVHRLWDYVPLHVSELANIPRWWGADIWVNGRRFALDRGRVAAYRRELDLRRGLLHRWIRWQYGDEGPVLEFDFRRFVNLAHPHQAALQIEVRAVSGEADVRVRTGLDAHVENPLPAAPAEIGLNHWQILGQRETPEEVALRVRTRETGIELAEVVRVEATADAPVTEECSDCEGQPAVERKVHLASGQGLRLAKFVGLCSSLEDKAPMVAAQEAARAAQKLGFERLLEQSAAAWAQTWDVCDVVIEGDIEAQIAMRFNLFQLLVAAPRWTEYASIGAKTLSGFGYRHHVFWDNEIFMLPLFIFTQPRLARNMLMYRYHNLPGARAKARANGYEGAQFPWESAGDGREVTPVWVPHFDDPRKLIRIWTGDIEIHITADIAYAVMQYWRVTGDDVWMRDYGAEMVLDGASFWASAARLEEDGRYHFRNVIGPDEYHDRVDDNAFTNYLARWHLGTARGVWNWLEAQYPERARELAARLDLSRERLERWQDVVERMYLPLQPETGLIEQFAGYFALQEPDFALLRDPGRTRSMQALLGIEGCQATQVIKQPDVLMLQYLLPEEFTPEQVQANYDFYDPRTDHEHGSSLGPAVSAIMACRVGRPEDAYRHFMRAARADLQDIRHNAADGIHGASAGGLWQAAVFGFGGLEIGPEGWHVEPRLPAHWSRLRFKFLYRGELQEVEISNSADTANNLSNKDRAVV
ncbi:MAG: glycoside hydrolase family 65 protein [Caldilineae bacterium]|nr:MAG: glycoside hydrolase family 65 protein [Caldilineae bacterium]